MIDDIYTDPDSVFALYQYGLTLYVDDAEDINGGGTTGASVTGGTGGSPLPPIIQWTPIGGSRFKVDPESLE